MAITAAGARVTAAHYRLQVQLRAGVLRDLARLWPLFDPTDFATFDAFAQLAAVLVVNGWQTSAGLATSYLSTFAKAERQAPMRAVLAPALERDVAAESLRATGLVGVLNARRSGFSLESAKAAGWVRLAGSATSLVLGGGRETVAESIKASQGVTRWQRVTSGEPCAFCAMLASRGPVYGEDADFEAHDHCSCTSEPAFSGSKPTAEAERFRDQWDRATEGFSGNDALNAFRTALAGDTDTD